MVFENIVMVAFQNIFFILKYVKIIFLKNYFWYQHIKIIWKYKKYIIFFKKIKIFLKYFSTKNPNTAENL
jgi:hypothetical protein